MVVPETAPQTRFRTRLSAAFVLVASVTTGVLVLGSYVIASEYRQRAFDDRATSEVRLALLSAPRDVSLDELDELLGEYQRRAGFESVAVLGDVTFSSSPLVSADDVPRELRSGVRPGRTRRAEITLDGRPFLVVAGRPSDSEATLYFFFSKEDLEDSLQTFRNVLAVGWLVAVAAAVAVGRQVAKRTLRPVRAAADAAHALAEGLLDTRLEHLSDDEFGNWSDAFNRMAEALEQKIHDLSRAAERERRFTSSVAHDLRTPLAGMSSAASLLEEELPELTPPARQVGGLLIDNVRRLETLVLELLELARLDVGQEEANLEPLSVRESVQAVLRSWDDNSSEVSLRHDGDPWVWADRARFKRVLSNLLANAVHHGGGEVDLKVRQEGERVVIDVMDRGPGIPPEDLERVFDRFYKADPARADSGSGLGLAIASENARLQGGAVEAANREGGGARFTLWLPRAVPPGDGDVVSPQ